MGTWILQVILLRLLTSVVIRDVPYLGFFLIVRPFLDRVLDYREIQAVLRRTGLCISHYPVQERYHVRVILNPVVTHTGVVESGRPKRRGWSL